MRRDADTGAAQRAIWESEWQKRLDVSQRKRLYDGLGQIFVSFCDQAGLKTPTVYTKTTIRTWGEAIGDMGLVRNALIHGATTVPKELAVFCEEPHSLGFDFVEGRPLLITLLHLQSVEAFCNQLLTALNLALVELAQPESKQLFLQVEGEDHGEDPAV